MNLRRNTFYPLAQKQQLLTSASIRSKQELRAILNQKNVKHDVPVSKKRLGVNPYHATLTALGLVIGLITASPVAASASELDLELAEQAAVVEVVPLPSQFVTVSVDSSAAVIVRDSFTATTPEELAATRAAEAARIEAERRASIKSSPVGALNKTGIAGNQIFAADSIISAAEQWVGVVPYGNGNNPSDSFSCDGYVQYVFSQNGISLPRGVAAQAALGTVISQSEAKAGDLVWYPGQHIGIYDGAGGMYDSPDWGRYVLHRSSVFGSPTYLRL